MRHHPALALLLGAACASRSAAPAPPVPTPPVAAPAVAAPIDAGPPVAAPATPADVARARLPGAGVRLAIAWPGAGGFDDVIAAVGAFPRTTGVNEPGVTWLRAGAEGPAALAYPTGELDAAGLATADVNGDGRPELLVFVRAGELPPAGTVVVFDLPPGHEQPSLLGRESAALDGARSLDEVRARLPLSRGLRPEDLADATTRSLVGRLAYATPAQLAALASPRLERCDVAYSRPDARPTRRCTALRPAALPPARFDDEVTRVFANALDALSVMSFECATAPRESCRSGRSGGFATEFVFDGAGPQRRLRSVTTTDSGLGE